MTVPDTPITVTHRELPLNLNDQRSPVWWGMVALITIEIMVFGSLIAGYFHLRCYAPEWPLGGISPPDLTLPAVNALILFASSIPMYFADTGIRKGNVTRLKVGLAIAFVMGVIFLVLKYIEYSGLDYDWTTNVYGSIVWTITGFHSAHVFALLLKTVVVMVAAWRGHFSERRNLGVQVNGLYWHFVVIIWVPLFFTLYLSHLVLP
jgi:cytochrome c oxidase subunit III